MERVIESYVHNGRIGVLVEFGAPSEITLRVEGVTQFMRDVALQIAASSPNDISEMLLQPFVKDPSTTINELLSELRAAVKENVEITRFVRWDVDAEAPLIDPPPRDPAMQVGLRVVK